jgi:hypothetical protein
MPEAYRRRWMAVQSVVALSTLVLVVARAVNVLS